MNSTKINKTKQYLSSQIIEHKKTITYVGGNPSQRYGYTQKVRNITNYEENAPTEKQNKVKLNSDGRH